MGSMLTPAKALLLAVHLAAHADVDGLRRLSHLHPALLRKEMLLRILLTHLPETLEPAAYVDFLKEIAVGELADRPLLDLDTSPVDILSDQQASKRVRRLRLAQLACSHTPTQAQGDDISLFLCRRAFRMDTETGMLSRLPDLLVPFLNRTPALRTWILSTVLPYVRRNSDYYHETAPAYSLVQFQSLPGPDAVHHLLSRTACDHVGRDLRGLVAPWVHDDARWVQVTGAHDGQPTPACLGWEHVPEWLTAQAAASWKVAVDAVEHWDGPDDVDFGNGVSLALSSAQRRYLDQSYARAVLASSYLVPEATVDALGGVYRMLIKARSLLGHGQGDLSLQEALAALPDMSIGDTPALAQAKTAAYMRNGLLQPRNP